MPAHSGETITIFKVEPREESGIVVMSPSQETDGHLADRHSAYHDNVSPPLTWTNVEGAETYAVIVEDPDAPREQPFVHWMIWNIPAEAGGLPEGVPPAEYIDPPHPIIQGRNDTGKYGWYGPRPPAGTGVHRYYFQVFALDQHVEVEPETPLVELLNILKGHTIAQGEMMATYEAPTRQ
ncbi:MULTISPECIES: YbhB/YbcL family Raf kinase inhibitor-like protein [Phenylobacterium]|uniref:Raf kinase inhibitor-like YbhB/YbcL family protein n=1 Tax=Phenylobacterium koreense TaxID=266125 RepID=A0ABV2EE28_9CAUL